MSIPSEAHLRAFGFLTYHYATVEAGLKICLSGILDLPLSTVMILTEPYGSVNLRNVIKSVAKEYTFPEKGREQLITIIGDLAAHSALRNFIAHSRSTVGARPGSIKPRGVDIRSDKAKFSGDDPSERDWTAKEMEAAADEIAKIDRRLKAFIQNMGLTARIERHMSSTSSATD